MVATIHVGLFSSCGNKFDHEYPFPVSNQEAAAVAAQAEDC
jgi:hypothetical protein